MRNAATTFPPDRPSGSHWHLTTARADAVHEEGSLNAAAVIGTAVSVRRVQTPTVQGLTFFVFFAVKELPADQVEGRRLKAPAYR